MAVTTSKTSNLGQVTPYSLCQAASIPDNRSSATAEEREAPLVPDGPQKTRRLRVVIPAWPRPVQPATVPHLPRSLQPQDAHPVALRTANEPRWDTTQDPLLPGTSQTSQSGPSTCLNISQFKGSMLNNTLPEPHPILPAPWLLNPDYVSIDSMRAPGASYTLLKQSRLSIGFLTKTPVSAAAAAIESSAAVKDAFGKLIASRKRRRKVLQNPATCFLTRPRGLRRLSAKSRPSVEGTWRCRASRMFSRVLHT